MHFPDSTSRISAVEGVPVLGTVGNEFLLQSVVVIDYAHATIRVLDPPLTITATGSCRR